MKLFPILFLLAVAAGEALDEICNSRKTPTNLIARRTWPSQIATTTDKPTTDTTTASPKSTTTAESSTVSTTAPTTTTTTAGTSTTGIPSTTSPKSSSTMLSSTSTTMATTTTPLPILFNCSISDPACGNMCTNLTSEGGVVQSPNFPGDYGNKEMDCQVIITAPEEWMIQLKFTTFNLETNVGFATVSGLAILLPLTTGNTIPVLVPATTSSMKINFQTFDSSKPSTAIYNWQATFSVSSQGSSCYVHDPEACGNMCTNVSSTGNGVVRSPNFPGDYGKNYKDCVVSIVVPAGKRIQLAFNTFNLESGKGEIRVHERGSLTKLQKTGSSTVPAVFTTAENIMLLQFISSSSTKPNTAIYNWQATYIAV